MGDACFPHYLGWHLLPDVCGYPDTRIVSVVLRSEGDVLCLPSPAHHLFYSKRLELSDTDWR